jgi:cell division protein FtsZ
VNLDFADIRTVMAEMGKAMMGTGEADGDNRAIRAAEAAINNPLLEETNMAGARGLLINITGGEDMTLFEVDQAANRIREEVAEDANIIFGSAVDDSLNGRIRVSVVATGIDTPVAQIAEPNVPRPRLVAVGGGMPVPLPVMAHGAPAVAHAMPMPAVNNVVQLDNNPQAQFLSATTEPEQVTMQAQPITAPQPDARPRGGLFTDPMQNQPAPAATTAPHLHRPSLFKSVTSALRRAPTGPEAARAEPHIAAEAPPTALVRPAVPEPEAGGLDIPAFLRRQSN